MINNAHKFDLDSSPLFESFEGLYYGDAVYSKEFGLGHVCGSYEEEKQKYVTLKEATDIFGISKAELFKSIAMNNIQTKTFGRSVMIHREDILKLNKKFRRDKKS